MNIATATERARGRLLPDPVPWLTRAPPAVHGSFDASAAEESGLRAEDVLDFSANGNVLGPSPRVADVIAKVDPSRYPDRGSRALRAMLARQHEVPDACVVPGNGSTELIWAIARAFLAPGSDTLVVGPTYGEYEAAAAVCGANVRSCPALLPQSGPDLQLIAGALCRPEPRVAWLCHPNNPTGTPFPLGALADMVHRHPATLFVVDEAYLTLSVGVSSALQLIGGGNVVVLRSLTKDAGLAGIRIGYAVAAERIADALRRAIPPWSVSSLAQAAALVAVADVDHLRDVKKAVAASREHLVRGLERLGYQPYPGVANFLLVPVGDAARVAPGLLLRGIAVRDCASFGLPDCIRIGVRSIADQDRLLAALAETARG